MFYGYYGGDAIGRNYGIDCYTQPIPVASPTGTIPACNQTHSSSPSFIGYGFPKSSEQPKPEHPGRHLWRHSDVLEEPALRGHPAHHPVLLRLPRSLVRLEWLTEECPLQHGLCGLTLHPSLNKEPSQRLRGAVCNSHGPASFYQTPRFPLRLAPARRACPRPERDAGRQGICDLITVLSHWSLVLSRACPWSVVRARVRCPLHSISGPL